MLHFRRHRRCRFFAFPIFFFLFPSIGRMKTFFLFSSFNMFVFGWDDYANKLFCVAPWNGLQHNRSEKEPKNWWQNQQVFKLPFAVSQLNSLSFDWDGKKLYYKNKSEKKAYAFWVAKIGIELIFSRSFFRLSFVLIKHIYAS